MRAGSKSRAPETIRNTGTAGRQRQPQNVAENQLNERIGKALMLWDAMWIMMTQTQQIHLRMSGTASRGLDCKVSSLSIETSLGRDGVTV